MSAVAARFRGNEISGYEVDDRVMSTREEVDRVLGGALIPTFPDGVSCQNPSVNFIT